MTTPQDLAAQIEALEKTEAWLRECSDWLLSNDLDMQCPMQTDPLDLADALPAIGAAIRQGEGAGDCISREQAASAIERTTVADGASASDILVFLAAAIRDDRVTPSISPAPDERDDEVRRLKAQLERIGKFVDDYKSPWGSWKTAWWEGEVSDNAAFSNDNALMHVANLSRAALSPAKGGE